MNWHGQTEQDRYFAELVVRGRRGGRFLDVGAHDGQTMSNTLALERDYGWTGVCIEANQDLATACRAARPGARVVESGVWSCPGWMTLETPASGDTLLSRLSGIPGNEDYFTEEFTSTVEQLVKVSPIRSLLLEDETWFDYFSLDVEGAELEALAGIDWDRTSFGFVIVEHGYRPGAIEALTEFMSARGYELHRVWFHDVEFTRPGFPVLPRSEAEAPTEPAAPPE